MDESRQSPALAARARQWLRGIWPDAGDRARGERVDRLYCDLVNLARTPAFYRDLGVPDTPEGRFEMVGLHVALVIRRLRAAGPPADGFAQDLFELMFADLDESLRQIGIGDLAVGRQIKRLAGQFYARLEALDQAFGAESRQALRAMLEVNAYHGGAAPSADQLSALADYVVAAEQTLRSRPAASLLGDRVHLAPPQPPSNPPRTQTTSAR
jgi:cytochrome b pre-mRNA-processing protein 3